MPMLTLVTGTFRNSNNIEEGGASHPEFIMHTQRGFTLIEVLLVVVLIAVCAVAVISTLPSNDKDMAKKPAQLLYQQLRLLNEEAILNGQDFGLRVDDKKSQYTFLTLTEKGWQKLKSDRLPAEVKMASGLSIKFSLGGSVWKSKDRLFESDKLFEESKFRDPDKPKKQAPPNIFILSSGEVTPFSLTLYPAHKSIQQDGWQVLTKANGEILFHRPGDADEK